MSVSQDKKNPFKSILKSHQEIIKTDNAMVQKNKKHGDVPLQVSLLHSILLPIAQLYFRLKYFFFLY